MELIMKRGCTWDSLTVDNVEEIDLTDEKRIEVLDKISKFIASMDIREFGEVIKDELEMYDSEEDLEYSDDFYSSLIAAEIIQPLEQYPNEWNHHAEQLSRQLRSYTSKYIRGLSPNELNYVLQHFVEILGAYEDCGYCECCGDIREIYTLEI